MTSWRSWAVLGAVFLAGLLLRVYSLVAFVVILAAILALARWWQEHSLEDVSYRRSLVYTRGFPGEQLEMQAIVENRKFLPLPWLRVQDSMPRAVGPMDENLLNPGITAEEGILSSLFTLRWYERDRRRYQLLLRKRGVYRLGPHQLGTGDLFGIFEQIGVSERRSRDFLTVFPQPVPFSALRLPADDPFGDRSARRRLYDDPNLPMGVRDYRPEDSFRQVHWPATARTGQLQTKVYQPVSARLLVLCLNVTTLKNYWEGTNPELMDHLVGVTATLAQRALGDGYQVGLISNGALAHADQPFRIPPGRSPAQMAQLLTALASVTPFVTGQFDRFLISQVPRLPYGATLVIVTGQTPPALGEALLRLSQRGRRVILLSFAQDEPPPLHTIQTVHNPFYT